MSTHYATNADLIVEVRISKEQGRVSNRLASMWLTMAQRYSLKPSFRGYSYRDEMVSDAVVALMRWGMSYDPDKSPHAFSYFTRCIHNAFVRRLNLERRQHDIRDEVLLSEGAEPSFGYADRRDAAPKPKPPADPEAVAREEARRKAVTEWRAKQREESSRRGTRGGSPRLPDHLLKAPRTKRAPAAVETTPAP